MERRMLDCVFIVAFVWWLCWISFRTSHSTQWFTLNAICMTVAASVGALYVLLSEQIMYGRPADPNSRTSWAVHMLSYGFVLGIKVSIVCSVAFIGYMLYRNRDVKERK